MLVLESRQLVNTHNLHYSEPEFIFSIFVLMYRPRSIAYKRVAYKKACFLLQTDQSNIFSNVSIKSKNIRVLFNEGAQKSLLNKKLSGALGLILVRKERKLLKGLKSKNKMFRKLDIVQTELRDIHGENRL